jgi:uncharacterized protein
VDDSLPIGGAKAVELFLVLVLGFLGSFGHCAGMCGPIAVAFSLSEQKERSLPFHLLLNLGRLLSYALVGVAIGGLGSGKWLGWEACCDAAWLW